MKPEQILRDALERIYCLSDKKVKKSNDLYVHPGALFEEIISLSEVTLGIVSSEPKEGYLLYRRVIPEAIKDEPSSNPPPDEL